MKEEKDIFKKLGATSLAVLLSFSLASCRKIDVYGDAETEPDEKLNESQESSTTSTTTTVKISETTTSAAATSTTTTSTEAETEATTSETSESQDTQSALNVAGAKEPSESAAKPESYFSNALFIGDSRMQSLMLYGSLYDADFLVERGNNAFRYFDDSLDSLEGNTTAAQFVASNANKYSDIYLNYGLNETGWPRESFLNQYKKVIEHIKSNQANANIYVCTVIPVSQSKDAEGNKYINNQVITSVNKDLSNVAKAEDVYYLNVNAAVTGGSAYLPNDISPDGVHFDKATVDKWQKFIQSHVVE